MANLGAGGKRQSLKGRMAALSSLMGVELSWCSAVALVASSVLQ